MSRLKQSYKKLLIILLSRFKKTKKEQWIEDRKKECDKCPFNTKNMNKVSLKQYGYNFLSNTLTLITTGKINEDNSACSLCSCTLAFKQKEITEKCDNNKWKK